LIPAGTGLKKYRNILVGDETSTEAKTEETVKTEVGL